MAERIIGTIYLLNEDGDSERQINISDGEYQNVSGTFGSLIIDMTVKPPKVQGKGNVWINTGVCERTSRIHSEESLSIVISSDGKKSTPIGNITCE